MNVTKYQVRNEDGEVLFESSDVIEANVEMGKLLYDWDNLEVVPVVYGNKKLSEVTQ